MKLKRIALVGRSGAGKSEAALHLATSHGFMVVNTGLILRSIAKELFGEEKKEHLHKLTDAALEIDELSILNAAIARANILEHSNVVIDAARTLAEVFHLKEQGYSILNIKADADSRAFRLGKRDGKRNATVPNHSTENISDIAMADFRVINETTLDDFHSNLDRILCESKFEN